MTRPGGNERPRSGLTDRMILLASPSFRRTLSQFSLATFAGVLFGFLGCTSSERPVDSTEPADKITNNSDVPIEETAEPIVADAETHVPVLAKPSFRVNLPRELEPVFVTSEVPFDPGSIYDVQSLGGQSFVILRGSHGQLDPVTWNVGDVEVQTRQKSNDNRRYYSYSAAWPSERKLIRIQGFSEDASQVILEDIDSGEQEPLDHLFVDTFSLITSASQSRVLMVSGMHVHHVWRLGQDPGYCELYNEMAPGSTAIHPDGQLFVSGERLNGVRSTRPGRAKVDLEGFDGKISTVEFSPDGDYLAVLGSEETYDPRTRGLRNSWRYAKWRDRIQVRDWRRNLVVLDIPGSVEAHQPERRFLEFSNSGQYLIWMSSEDVISTCRIAPGAKPVEKRVNFNVRGMAVSGDDKYIVLADEYSLSAFSLDQLTSEDFGGTRKLEPADQQEIFREDSELRPPPRLLRPGPVY